MGSEFHLIWDSNYIGWFILCSVYLGRHGIVFLAVKQDVYPDPSQPIRQLTLCVHLSSVHSHTCRCHFAMQLYYRRGTLSVQRISCRSKNEMRCSAKIISQGQAKLVSPTTCLSSKWIKKSHIKDKPVKVPKKTTVENHFIAF